MKAAIQVIAALIIILMLGAVVTALDSFRLDEQVDPFTVTSGNTSAQLTLSQSLYNADTANVISITSNTTTDAALPSTYVSATKVLTITGLDSTASHYLYVTYYRDGLEEYFGAQTASRTVPVLLILGVISIVGGAVYLAWSKFNG